MTHDVADILAHPSFATATEALRRDHDRFVEEIVTLTEIPAPPFKEERRAQAYLEMLRAHGLEECTQDAEGNVMGLRRGRGNGSVVVVSAHLDTVFPEGTDVTVRREGTKLFAPGIGDDTRGLASLLSYIRALDAGGIRTDHDILFMGDVGEEGKGDLRGVRHFFAHNPLRDKVTAFFTIDGIETEDLVTKAVGSNRYKVVFNGPGGHSLGAFGTVNPAYSLGQFLSGMSRIEVPKDPRTSFCASVFGGGTSVNAIPEEVWVEIDLRSVSPDELNRIDAEVRRLADEAAQAENTRGDTASGTITVSFSVLGARPAGSTPEDARIVAASEAAIRAFGFSPKRTASSTDANIPMSLGVPAVKFGHGGAGGRAHSLEEWIDVEPDLSLRGQSAALAAILGTAGMEI
ncbi:M20/M25/M40 family metallo-hydrolase [Falsirhodobacter halotolerans]|uniref:M20/M25/M40 family metallo-hydrolase n=1 Tax=Falsirhodobacter halotolerans TaxID=1146892 RepID=UPI001FD54F9A|nr:M20/M25/M40 family metallo-hydrolase [Falsirhodobacter halotolerans]MCJ8141168.1 M20/M25/M40 family metallo-hydrolase [Falsirhodobacter halotolerans]